jgi:cytochrome P450
VYRLSDPAAYVAAVPHDELRRQRRTAPIAWIDEVPLMRHAPSGSRAVVGTGFWAVTSHRLVTEVSRRPDAFSSWQRGSFLADPKSRDDLDRTRQSLINMDAPEHTKLRHVVTTAFTSAVVERLQESIRAHARAIVDRVVQREQFDVVGDVAAELPLLVLTDLLGLPRQDRALMFEWSNNLVGFDDPEYGGGDVGRYQRTYVEAFQYARELAALRRRQPADDLISALVGAHIDGRPLSDTTFCHLFLLLVVGGNESTRHLLSGSLAALCEWPDQRRRLAESPALLSTAVEELLRWISPIMQFRRTATRDVTIGGQQVREGDKLVLYYVSANRDETVFDAPDVFDVGRKNNPHLAFGVGPHFCLGARLARVEAAVLLDQLRPHLSALELIGPVSRLQSNFMNGIKSIPARFHRQPA